MRCRPLIDAIVVEGYALYKKICYKATLRTQLAAVCRAFPDSMVSSPNAAVRGDVYPIPVLSNGAGFTFVAADGLKRNVYLAPPRSRPSAEWLHDDDPRRAGLERADLRRVLESFLLEEREYRRRGLRIARDEQPAARLGIGQQLLSPFRQIRRQLDVRAGALPVAGRGAGGITVLGEMQRRGKDRYGGVVEARRELRAAAHLEQVAEQAEAGDVGQRVHAVH